MKRDPVNFEITDDTGSLYEGNESEMVQVFEIMISDLKALQARYGKQATAMKVAYSKKPKGTLKLIQIHKLQIIP